MSSKMTPDQVLRTAIKPVLRARCVERIYFPRKRKWVDTERVWALGQTTDGRWCASNGRTNGRWFPNREALDAYARFLASRHWEVSVVR